jgi:tRNA pseudouridine38-40 synthase
MDKSLKRVLCTVMYHGAHYSGWQVQDDKPSIQSTIQSVLSRMHHHPVKIAGSGRTDAGVHAFGQCFHFDTDLSLSEERWVVAINSQLPKDIRILDARFVHSKFHARYSVLSKRYDYLISKEESNPFSYQTHLSITKKLNYHAMNQAISVLIGTHDFSSFCSNTKEEMPNQVRTLMHFECSDEGEQIRFILIGDGFLRYMVRMLVAVVLDVGLGKLQVKDVQDILDKKDKRAYSGIVDPCGLYLMEVHYKEDEE